MRTRIGRPAKPRAWLFPANPLGGNSNITGKTGSTSLVGLLNQLYGYKRFCTISIFSRRWIYHWDWCPADSSIWNLHFGSKNYKAGSSAQKINNGLRFFRGRESYKNSFNPLIQNKVHLNGSFSLIHAKSIFLYRLWQWHQLKGIHLKGDRHKVTQTWQVIGNDWPAGPAKSSLPSPWADWRPLSTLTLDQAKAGYQTYINSIAQNK